MTHNQIAMRNIARGTAGQYRGDARVSGSEALKYACRGRYLENRESTAAKWHALDEKRTTAYRARRAERERKAAEAEARRESDRRRMGAQ